MIATTKEGKKVILYDNNTWEFFQDISDKDNKQPHFRKAYWGMSMEDVINIESAELLKEEDDYLVYLSRVSSLDCNILYIFISNILVRAKYIITEIYSNLNNYIKAFDGLKINLSSKYGNPDDDQIWYNDLYKDDYQDWGTAISIGHLSYFTSFDTPETKIVLYLYGENYEVNLGIEYMSKELSYLQDQLDKQKIINDL